MQQYEAQRDTLARRLRELADPSERMVLALAHTCDGDSCRDPDLLCTVFPELWHAADAVAGSLRRPSPPWNSDALARWFAGRAVAADVPFSQPARGRDGMWWTPRRGTPRKGWAFPSTEYKAFPEYMEKPGFRIAMFIERNGERWRHDSDHTATSRVLRANSLASGGELHVTALQRMAALLGMNEARLRLDGPPRPGVEPSAPGIIFPG